MAVCFKGAHFPQDILLTYMRWYVAYPLSTRHVEELMLARGVHVDHSTMHWWVIKYSPQLEEALHRRKRLYSPFNIPPETSDSPPAIFTVHIIISLFLCSHWRITS